MLSSHDCLALVRDSTSEKFNIKLFVQIKNILAQNSKKKNGKIISSNCISFLIANHRYIACGLNYYHKKLLTKLKHKNVICRNNKRKIWIRKFLSFIQPKPFTVYILYIKNPFVIEEFSPMVLVNEVDNGYILAYRYF